MERNERYAEYLLGTAKRMEELAGTLGKGRQPLNKEEKGLIRIACAPAVEELLTEVRVDFLAGFDATKNKSLSEAIEIMRDLHD